METSIPPLDENQSDVDASDETNGDLSHRDSRKNVVEMESFITPLDENRLDVSDISNETNDGLSHDLCKGVVEMETPIPPLDENQSDVSDVSNDGLSHHDSHMCAVKMETSIPPLDENQSNVSDASSETNDSLSHHDSHTHAAELETFIPPMDENRSNISDASSGTNDDLSHRDSRISVPETEVFMPPLDENQSNVSDASSEANGDLARHDSRNCVNSDAELGDSRENSQDSSSESSDESDKVSERDINKRSKIKPSSTIRCHSSGTSVLCDSSVNFDAKMSDDSSNTSGNISDGAIDQCIKETSVISLNSSTLIEKSKSLNDKEKSLETLELDFEEDVQEKEEISTRTEAEDKKDDGDDEQKPPSIQQDKADEKEEGEEGDDDGEVSDVSISDDDLEEGEVKDPNSGRKSQPRPICRFYNKGQCTWGTSCRFIHPGVNDKGNYNMFGPPRNYPVGMGPPPGIGPLPGSVSNHMGPVPLPPNVPDYLPPIPPPPPSDAPLGESAWERGLRHAKELMKKASRRKEQEPDFEEKRLNLTIDGNDSAGEEFDKEDDYYARSPTYRRPPDVYSYYRYEEVRDYDTPLHSDPRDHWRAGRYENFEVRWPKREIEHRDHREKERVRANRRSYDREKIDRRSVDKDRWRDERYSEVPSNRRGDEWRDPWRRSKTPKGRRSRSRGRSRRSYSSGSSRSYSSRSSRSSYTYSHSSSSRRSYYSSRSRSYSSSPSPRRSLSRSPRKPRASTRKRPPLPSPIRIPMKPRPREVPVVEPRKYVSSPASKKPAVTKKPEPVRGYRSPSFSRSESSHSVQRSANSKWKTVRSSSSRSPSPSISRSVSRSLSRSFSRSLSMSSVSSASSSLSHSSSGSESEKAGPVKPKKEHSVKHLPQKVEPVKEVLNKEVEKDKRISVPEVKEAPLPEKKMPSNSTKLSTPTVLLPKLSKDPLKQTSQKIKLTLLNKSTDKPVPKKENTDSSKLKLVEKDDPPKSNRPSVVASTNNSRKRQASSPPRTSLKVTPPPSLPLATTPNMLNTIKKSTTSRREELLKQLKAVEDAIARKRSKMS